MLRNLLHISNEQIAGLPVFGFGWLLLIWAVLSVVLMVWLIRRFGSNAEVWGYLPLLVLVGAAIAFLLPRICDQRGLPIRGYGVMLLVAVASAVGLAAWRGRRMGVDPEQVFTLSFWAFVPGIIGARVFYVIEYWDSFRGLSPGEFLWAMVNVSQGGLVVYGSIIGGIVGVVAFIYKSKMPPLATFDLLVPSLALGMAIGRIGCFLNGCCYGGQCDLPWSVKFPSGSPAYHHQWRHGELELPEYIHGLKLSGDADGPVKIAAVLEDSQPEELGLREGQEIIAINGQRVDRRQRGEERVNLLQKAQAALLDAHNAAWKISIKTADGPRVEWEIRQPADHSKPVHPTQLYSSLNSVIICLFLLAYAPFCRRDGQVWAAFLTLYPITRFLLEMIRTDEPGVFGPGLAGLQNGLTISQLVSLILLFCAGVFWIHLWTKPPGKAFASHQSD